VQQFVQLSGGQTNISSVLCELRKIDVLVNLFDLIDDDAPEIQAPLESIQVFGWLYCKSLLPETVDVPLSLFVVCFNI
jgi:hypothetical protein